MDVKRYTFTWSETRGGYNCLDASAAGLPLVLATDFDAVLKELNEQCRLQGMGSEREAKLMAERDALQRLFQQYIEYTGKDRLISEKLKAIEERDALQGKLKVAVDEFKRISRGNRMLVSDAASLSRNELSAAIEVVADAADEALAQIGLPEKGVGCS